MENHRVDAFKIKQFWEWFSKNCQNFGIDFDNAVLLEELDEWISRLGDFSWEVGPGKTKENGLVISPNGSADLLQDTKEIIKNAKDCTGWEYYYAKPVKEWELIFDFETSEEEIVEVDASKWEYVLLQYEDRMLEIIIQASDLCQLDESDKQAATEILLDGVLGEETRIQTICAIDVVEEFENEYREKAGNIKNLPAHLKALTKQ